MWWKFPRGDGGLLRTRSAQNQSGVYVKIETPRLLTYVYGEIMDAGSDIDLECIC